MQQAKANGIRILVVEDEPTICEVCLRTLTVEGFDVDISVNGEAAKDVLPKKEYDLCLIDIRTPLMNGKELYHHIEEKYPRLAKGVIFTTADIWIVNWSPFSATAKDYICPSHSLPMS